MSLGSAQDAKETVRQATDIVQLVGSYLEIRRQGRNYVARCPWHDDSRPSMTINPERQSWRCWVCAIGGDVFSFVMKKENIEFREALEMLADRANIKLARGPVEKAPEGSANDKNTLYACMAWAQKLYADCLNIGDSGAPGRAYVGDRKLSAESVAKFGLGFVPNEWKYLVDRARHTTYSPEVLEACGLALKSDRTGEMFDRFRGRLMFPIRDVQGRTIAFGGRILPQWSAENPAKYINSPETRLFSKSDHVYALDLAKEVVSKSRAITVVEGYTDVIMAHQHGLNDVVACLGTALNDRHIRLLKRFADTITLLLDGDEAGQRRTNEVLELFVAAGVDLRVLTLPEEFDPCEFLEERGADEFRRLAAGAVDALTHKIRTATAGVDLARDSHRANKALESILSTLAVAPMAEGGSGAGSASALQLRMQPLLARLARDFRVDVETLRARVKELRAAKLANKPVNTPTPEQDSFPDDQATTTYGPLAPKDLHVLERHLFELLVIRPEMAPTALEELGPEDLPTSAARDLLEAFRRVETAGRDVTFEAVLSELENDRLQGLLVAIDEEAQRKAEAQEKRPEGPADWATLLRDIIQKLRADEERRLRRERLDALDENRLDIDRQTDLFLQLLEEQKRKRGIAGT